VAFITYLDFLMLGLDPLVNYAAKLHFTSGGRLQVPMVVKATAGAKGQGPTHAQALDAWLVGVPGLTVVAPSTGGDAYGLMKSALRSSGPVVFLDHKRLFPLGGEVPDSEELVPIGRASIRREGRHATIVAHSYMAVVSLEAARTLARDGIDVEVVDLRSLWPLDREALASSARRTGHVLVVEEGQATCGLGAELAFGLRESVPGLAVARLGARRVPIASSAPLEAACVPNAERIAAAIRALLDGRGKERGERA
jgi:pyruvate dehydrogenase E1 component beta subunit